MEAIYTYLLKANALIALFFLAYYFLVQKETFFTSNRWFLVLGLFSSALIPLFFIKKTVVVEAPKLISHQAMPITHNPTILTAVGYEKTDWHTITVSIYSIISIILVTKIILELISFFKLIQNEKVTLSKPFAFIDIDQNINPFSFFKYIVFNSKKYSPSELQNILNHEKVHSKEKHSADVLIAKIFCTLFWFNPFIWLYKKAIIQNLEYIADKKAIQNIQDKKAYQMTLLKVVTDHNCLSITNSFYQSLIKKRIVMLNKNQSNQKNAWKYAVIFPALVAFVLLFQIKVIAQEKRTRQNDNPSENRQVTEMIWTKDTPEDEMERDVLAMKRKGMEVTYSNVTRNAKEEITSITIAFRDKDGKKGRAQFTYEDAIKPIVLRKETDANANTKITLDEQTALEDTTDLSENSADSDQPVPPVPPTPNFKDMPKPPTAPKFPTSPNVAPPKNINDKKAWKEFEEKMQKFEAAWNTPEIKKYEAEMAVYEKKMEEYEPVMASYEKEMEKYERKMEAYQEEIERYQERLSDQNQEARERAENSKELIKKHKR